jgi:hypothetical protein
MATVPVIDVAGLVAGHDDPAVGAALDRACRDMGFFYVSGHGVDDALQQRLDDAARAFFALPEATKGEISMASGGRAWRGWVPLGGELTAGRPDSKEGLYLGAELSTDDPRVATGTPLHGPNLFPAAVPELRAAVLEYLEALTALGQAVLRGMAVGLGLPAGWFHQHLTADPLVLFRILTNRAPYARNTSSARSAKVARMPARSTLCPRRNAASSASPPGSQTPIASSGRPGATPAGSSRPWTGPRETRSAARARALWLRHGSAEDASPNTSNRRVGPTHSFSPL